MVAMEKKYKVASTLKAFEILWVIAGADPHQGLSLADIGKELPVSKSTIHRYLSTLEELRFVEKDDRGNFYLGSGILELAGNYLSNMSLPRLADPYMRDLAEKSQETIHLAIPSHNEVIYVGKVDGPLSIRLIATIGTRMPMYCTALGKSMLAHLPQEIVDAVIAQGLEPRTKNTITSTEGLIQNIVEVGKLGYAVDDIENEEGVRCVGAPIFDYSQKLVGAISISGPDYRVTEERAPKLGLMIKDTALAISRRMGYPL